MKIKLTRSEIKKLTYCIPDSFKRNYDKDIIYITDYLYSYFFSYFAPVSIEDFYDTLDAYKDLQETYQTLVYHHELYKKGKTPLDAFIGVCDGLSVDDIG